MALFDDFPLITYNARTIKDISKRLFIPDTIKNNAAAYKAYFVKDSEKIEDVAYKAYGDSNLHWLIMLMNDIVDPFYDWPLSLVELNAFIDNKYSDGRDGIHHWELDGRVVHSSVGGAVSISNGTYETTLNEEKRKINLLRPEHVSMVTDQEQTILR